MSSRRPPSAFCCWATFVSSCSFGLDASSVRRVCASGSASFCPQLLLLLRQFARLAAHLAKIIVKLPRALLPKLVAQILQLPLRPRPGRQRLRRIVFLHRLRRLLRLAARLFELLALFRHLRCGSRLLHLLLRLIHVREELLLLLLEPFELALQFVLLLLRLRLLERSLQFLQPLIDVVLPLREFLQPVEKRELFALLLLLRLRVAFVFRNAFRRP